MGGVVLSYNRAGGYVELSYLGRTIVRLWAPRRVPRQPALEVDPRDLGCDTDDTVRLVPRANSARKAIELATRESE